MGVGWGPFGTPPASHLPTLFPNAEGERRGHHKELGLEDPGAPEVALAICLGAGMGWESRGCGSFLWGGRSLPFSTKTTALSEVEALVQQLNKIQQQQPTPTPLIPCTWASTLLSRASIEKGNRCLLEQNAVYAEQVEINLQELFQSVAGSLLMATYQPFWGEMIYC